MVFEQIFKPKWLERRPSYAFLLGVIYSIIGILCARLIFPRSTAYLAIAFTAVLLIPSLNKLLEIEEEEDVQRQRFSLRY
ncbi:hypothetical protein ACFL1H_07220 [Nanoarchaeota archaeon]